MERRLTAILASDVVAYSRLMGADEEGTLATLKTYRSRFEDLVGQRGGRVFSTVGDCMMAEFSSPVEAVRCAVKFQQDLRERNAKLPAEKRMLFRAGVNLGDVVAEGGNLVGDGVNIAARLEALAPPGGICISKAIADQIAGKVDMLFVNIGDHNFKNIVRSVEVWAWPPDEAGKLRRAPRRRFWIAGLTALAATGAVAAYLAVGTPDAPDLPTGPRVALIPFKNVGDNPDDAFFSEGLTRDVNALLAKFSNLFVLAPQAGESFRDDPDCTTIRKELNADYILTGTVRRAANELRVTTTFTDAKTCVQLQAPGPFESDLSVSSVFDIQLEIAQKIAALVGSGDAPLFSVAVQQNIRDKVPASLGAYECVLLGYWFYQTFAAPEFRKARQCLERAVVEEPGYSYAWSRLAFIYIESKKRSIDTPPNWARLADEAANKAIELDRGNADAYYARAVLSRVKGEYIEIFERLAEEAIELNPNDSWILADLGIFLAYSGQFERGKEWITRARALNPKLHPGFGYAWILHSFLRGDYEDAVKRQVSRGGLNAMTAASLAASYAMNGEQQKAEETLALIHEQYPDYLIDPRAPFRARGMPKELIEGLMEGLRRSGLDVPPEAVGN